MEASEADNEYMTMDADQWDNQDDTYENGDTLGLDVGRKEDSGAQAEDTDSKDKKKKKNRGKAATERAQQMLHNVRTGLPSVPPPDRYMTFRRPIPGTNRGLSKKQKLVFFKSTVVWLVVLCTVLIGVLIALSIIYNILAGTYIKESEKIDRLRKENNELKMQTESAENRSRFVYRISSADNPDCVDGEDLFVLNYRVLEEHLRNRSFVLYYSTVAGGLCFNHYAWNCTC